MALEDGYSVATKVKFNFKVNSDPKRLAFAAQVKNKLCKVFCRSHIKTRCLIPRF